MMDRRKVGANEKGRNGMGVVLSKEFKESLVSVDWRRDGDECQAGPE